MKLDAYRSVLLVIDLQERLLPAIDGGASIIEHSAWLIGVARQLNVPVLFTEQYPQGLGSTAPDIAQLIQPDELLEKTHFSAVAEGTSSITPPPSANNGWSAAPSPMSASNRRYWICWLPAVTSRLWKKPLAHARHGTKPWRWNACASMVPISYRGKRRPLNG